MAGPKQEELFSPLSDLQAAQWLLGELHDDLPGRASRFQQVNDLCANLGRSGTMIPGEVAYSAWIEARSSFVNGNYVATVMLCQGLAEQMLASHLTLDLNAPKLPKKIGFQDTLNRCVDQGVIDQTLAGELKRLMDLRNPLSGVVCGRGRNPTLRLWPAIFSGEIDVFPSERRNMGQEIGR